jgi:carbon monoxide dehydrogenase subunit G
MASVRKEFSVEAPAERVWAALADFQAVHKRLAPGFVTDSKPDGEAARIVTFANGSSAREILVNSDAKQKRLVYSVVGNERLTHHNASAQVIAEGPNKSRFVWTADFLPDALAPYIDAQMQQGGEVMKRALEGG